MKHTGGGFDVYLAQSKGKQLPLSISRYVRLAILSFVLMAGCFEALGQGTHWNQFRGPTGDGIGHAQDLPLEFNETTNLRWKTAIHDEGWSSPVVWGDRIWLTTAREDGSELFALCIDLNTGKIIHDIKVFDEPNPQVQYGGNNTHATPTPILEEGRAYIHFGSYGTACLDTRTGEKLWENRELKCDHRVRPASSPIIDGNSLFLTFDGIDVQFVASLDKNTGEVQWITHRAGHKNFGDTLKAEGFSDTESARTSKQKPNDNRKSYSTPTIIEYQGKKQLISPGAEVTYSYDPETGDENWHVTHDGWGWNVASRPVFANDLVYLTMGISRRLVAVRPSGSGDVTETHIAWSADGRVPEISSPIVVGDLLFMVVDRGGSVYCLEADTGEQIWRERFPGGGTFWGSPVYADGKIYIASTKGNVYVFAAAREFELLAVNEFNSSDTKQAASPAKVAPTSVEQIKDMLKAKGMSETDAQEFIEGARAKDISDFEIAALVKGGGKITKGDASGRESGVRFIASPAIAGDSIILRSETHLYCISKS